MAVIECNWLPNSYLFAVVKSHCHGFNILRVIQFFELSTNFTSSGNPPELIHMVAKNARRKLI